MLQRWLRAARRIVGGDAGSPLALRKEREWRGYYAYYRSEAGRKGMAPVAVLDAQWADGQQTAELVRPYLVPGATVLEIACGMGRVARFVVPHCQRLHCSDILEDALAEAKTTLSAFDNVSFHKTNGYDLREFGADAFDCVYSFTAFFHFDFDLVVHYFAEIRRVLKPGGVAILEFKQWKTERDVSQLVEKIAEEGGIQRHESVRDKWRYVSPDMLALLCEYYDLEVLDDDVTRYTMRKPAR
jgi:ubiquinone/menaquinone biosynthesis C-methylase UbiE